MHADVGNALLKVFFGSRCGTWVICVGLPWLQRNSSRAGRTLTAAENFRTCPEDACRDAIAVPLGSMLANLCTVFEASRRTVERW